jgi:osmotically inducible protein OsmC
MKSIVRMAEAYWHGDLKEGDGSINTDSGALDETPYDFKTRFGNEVGTNPEELIAAAHAACYSMAFAGALSKNGYDPEIIHTRAACTMNPKEGGGYEIVRMILDVEVQAGGLEESNLKSMSEEGDRGCPVSNLLRSCISIDIRVRLIT